MKNVRNYVEETETYILNDEHTPPEIVDEGWAFFVERDLCHRVHDAPKSIGKGGVVGSGIWSPSSTGKAMSAAERYNYDRSCSCTLARHRAACLLR